MNFFKRISKKWESLRHNDFVKKNLLLILSEVKFILKSKQIFHEKENQLFYCSEKIQDLDYKKIEDVFWIIIDKLFRLINVFFINKIQYKNENILELNNSLFLKEKKILNLSKELYYFGKESYLNDDNSPKFGFDELKSNYTENLYYSDNYSDKKRQTKSNLLTKRKYQNTESNIADQYNNSNKKMKLSHSSENTHYLKKKYY